MLTLDGSAAGSATFNHDVILPNNGILQLGDAGENISGDGTNLTITSSGDVIMKLTGEQLILNDGSSNIAQFDLTSNHFNITSLVNDKDMIFKGFDGGGEITALTLDMSAAGAATFNDKITAVGTSVFTNLDISGDVDIDGTLEADAITINGTAIASVLSPVAGGSSIVTTGALDSGSITSGFGAIDNGTSNIRSATITAETAFVPDAANGATLGTASLEFADLFLHDGAQILFGADQDVVLTHAADVGLTLKTATTSDDTKATLTLQTGDTDIAANDVLGQLHFQAPDEGAGTDAILVAAGIAAISEGDFSASNNATKLSFQTGASEAASEKMSLSSAGILNTTKIGVVSDHDLGTGIHIKTADSGASVNAGHDELVVEGSGNSGISILSGTSSNGAVLFGDSGNNADGYLNYDHTNRKLDFGTAGATQWSLDSSGNFLPAATDHGIYLGVTSATAANLLDDYEEGTWSPAFSGTSGASSGVTFGTRFGSYTKIGRQVTVNVYIDLDAVVSMPTGDLTVATLPFTSSNEASTYRASVSISYAKNFDEAPSGGQIINNSTVIYFRKRNTSSALENMNNLVTTGNLNANSEIMLTATYDTA